MEEHFRSLIEKVVGGIHILNDDGTIRYLSPSVEGVLGYEPQELMGQSIFELLHPDDVPHVFQAFTEAIQKPGPDHFIECRIRHKDGSWRVIEALANNLLDDPAVAGVIIHSRDITERKRAEEELRESEERYYAIFEQAADSIVLIDAETGALVEFNDRARENLGYTREEFEKLKIPDFEVIESAEEVAKHIEKIIKEGADTFETRHRTKDGEIRDIQVSSRAISIRGRDFVQSIWRDITERKRAEEDLIRLSGAVRMSADGIVLSDLEGRILEVNEATLDMYGADDKGDLIGKSSFALIAPEEQEKALAGMAEVMEKGYIKSREYHVITKNGSRIPVEMSVALLKDVEGKPIGFVAMSRDIAERKRAEEQTRLRDRLAAVGQLAAGIAHDFNNLLTSIIGFAQLLHMRADMPGSAKADLERIIEGGHRAAHLIRQILDFSRKSIISPQPLDLAPFLKEAIKFLQRTIPENIRIVLEMGPGEYLVNADPSQIQQALTNLAVNARDAMPGSGELRFRLSHFTLKPGDRRPFPGMEPGAWITLSVSDTGAGIPPEVLPHLYEPFFTTKEPGGGTGLGLAQVYGIVKQHEGFIDVETGVGKGTTFIIYLPPLAVREAEPGEKAAAETPRGQGETILLVEDEPQVLGVCKAMLEHLGYRVLTATTGLQALGVYDQHGREIALVLADIVMPQMGGLELFHTLRSRDPAVRVVVMTGYPLREGGRELLAQGIVDWVLKPPDLFQLAQVVRQALK